MRLHDAIGCLLGAVRRAASGCVRVAAAPGLLAVCGATPTAAQAKPSISQYDQPKYPADFTHFDYANPDAPANGSLSFENYNELQTYDSLNPFLVRGAPAPDIQNLMFDTLMQRSWDELASEYPLIADDVDVAPDLTSATFHINPAARFSNGDPITAADVKYSFDTLTSRQASPLFNAQFAVIKSATVIDKGTIRFDFRHAERDAPLIAGDLPIFSPKWGMQADGKRPPFDQIASMPPISSGPYLIDERKNDKQIRYRRNPDYWAANLPSRRGMFRFERITFKLYRDHYTQLEAFKAGDADVIVEYSATQWARKYVGKNFDNGLLKKGDFADGPAADAGPADEYAQADVPGSARAPRLDAGVRLRLDEPDDVLRSVPAHRTAISRPVRSARPACRARRNWRCSNRCAPACRRKCSARCSSNPIRLRRHSLRGNLRVRAICWRKPAGTIATARCATRTARR